MKAPAAAMDQSVAVDDLALVCEYLRRDKSVIFLGPQLVVGRKQIVAAGRLVTYAALIARGSHARDMAFFRRVGHMLLGSGTSQLNLPVCHLHAMQFTHSVFDAGTVEGNI